MLARLGYHNNNIEMDQNGKLIDDDSDIDAGNDSDDSDDDYGRKKRRKRDPGVCYMKK